MVGDVPICGRCELQEAAPPAVLGKPGAGKGHLQLASPRRQEPRRNGARRRIVSFKNGHCEPSSEHQLDDRSEDYRVPRDVCPFGKGSGRHSEKHSDSHSEDFRDEESCFECDVCSIHARSSEDDGQLRQVGLRPAFARWLAGFVQKLPSMRPGVRGADRWQRILKCAPPCRLSWTPK